MDIFDLLSESQMQNVINELRSIHSESRWVEKVNNMLGQLPHEQIGLLRLKFRSINNPNLRPNIDQLINSLVEILVAAEYRHNNPRFFHDKLGNPDIYLEKTKQWIEVKCLNNSEYEKDFNESEHNIITSMIRIGPAGSLRKEDNDHYKKWSHKKLFDENAKDPGLVYKAFRQLAGHDGFLYFVYSVDFATSWNLLDVVSKSLEEDVKSYCRRKNVAVITKNFLDLLE